MLDHCQDIDLRAVEEIGGEEVKRQDPPLCGILSAISRLLLSLQAATPGRAHGCSACPSSLRRPSAPLAPWRAARTSSGLVTSPAINAARPPSALMPSAMERPSSLERPNPTTAAPSLARRFAIASPIVRVAPVTIATLPLSP